MMCNKILTDLYFSTVYNFFRQTFVILLGNKTELWQTKYLSVVDSLKVTPACRFELSFYKSV